MVVDRNIITSRAPGTAVEFTLKLLGILFITERVSAKKMGLCHGFAEKYITFLKTFWIMNHQTGLGKCSLTVHSRPKREMNYIFYVCFEGENRDEHEYRS